MISIMHGAKQSAATQQTSFAIRQNTIRKVNNSGLTQEKGLFKLSHKIDYGLFLMMELAKHSKKEPVSLRTVADQNQMSFFFLQKVANDLRNGGLIVATRGKNGGYVLAKSTQITSLKEILEALEGPIAVMHCLTHGSTGSTCVREGWCTMKPGLNAINQILIDVFTQTTLKDIS